MDQDEARGSKRIRDALRTITVWAAVLMLPPFFVVAVAPMLIVLAPVALVAIPFLVPALLPSSRAAQQEQQLRRSLRPLPAPVASYG